MEFRTIIDNEGFAHKYLQSLGLFHLKIVPRLKRGALLSEWYLGRLSREALARGRLQGHRACHRRYTRYMDRHWAKYRPLDVP